MWIIIGAFPTQPRWAQVYLPKKGWERSSLSLAVIYYICNSLWQMPNGIPNTQPKGGIMHVWLFFHPVPHIRPGLRKSSMQTTFFWKHSIFIPQELINQLDFSAGRSPAIARISCPSSLSSAPHHPSVKNFLSATLTPSPVFYFVQSIL